MIPSSSSPCTIGSDAVIGSFVTLVFINGYNRAICKLFFCLPLSFEGGRCGKKRAQLAGVAVEAGGLYTRHSSSLRGEKNSTAPEEEYHNHMTDASVGREPGINYFFVDLGCAVYTTLGHVPVTGWGTSTDYDTGKHQNVASITILRSTPHNDTRSAPLKKVLACLGDVIPEDIDTLLHKLDVGGRPSTRGQSLAQAAGKLTLWALHKALRGRRKNWRPAYRPAIKVLERTHTRGDLPWSLAQRECMTMLADVYCSAEEGARPPYEHLRGWSDILYLIPRRCRCVAGLTLKYVPSQRSPNLNGYLKEEPRADRTTVLGPSVLAYFDGRGSERWGHLLRPEMLSRDGVAFVVSFLLWGLQYRVVELREYTYAKHCQTVSRYTGALARALLGLTPQRFADIHARATEMHSTPPHQEHCASRLKMPYPVFDRHPKAKIARFQDYLSKRRGIKKRPRPQQSEMTFDGRPRKRLRGKRKLLPSPPTIPHAVGLPTFQELLNRQRIQMEDMRRVAQK